ncbi:MAG: hypothetical protein WA160_04540 [Pseudobdellovibrio sp.]
MKKVLLLVPFIFLAACNPKKDTSKAANVRANTFSPIGGLSNSVCANGTSSVGAIYDSGTSSASGTFEDRVKALLSATVDPSEIGQISSSPTDATGVRFKGMLKLDQSGNVVAASSSMSIKVYDSYVVNSQLDASGNKMSEITIDFSASKGTAITGQFNVTTGDGSVSFSDKYGVVRFVGRLDAQNFSGTVSFQNNVNVNGGAGASGTLGQFSVARCGIIQ